MRNNIFQNKQFSLNNETYDIYKQMRKYQNFVHVPELQYSKTKLHTTQHDNYFVLRPLDVINAPIYIFTLPTSKLESYK